jgi:subtilisin family serine protease
VYAAGATFIDREPQWQPAVIARDASSVATRSDGPSCPITTPAYDARQGYRAALAVDAAWNRPGGRGQGVAVADVEGEWNHEHEDLPGARMKHVAGVRQRGAAWRAHGTAVLGVVAAQDNGRGMLGLAPDVSRIVTASLGGIGAARAIYEAARALAPGDVLIVELHGPGPNADGRGQKGFVPMEFWQPEFDAIRWATKKGVIVVEAAGNGGEDLDASVYGGKFDRRLRDSEAILVGAADPQGRPLGFSNSGSRVDVHGWGGGVATLDYGDLQGCSVPARKYTAQFSGTSSASPIVAGAAIVVQGVAKERGRALSPREMRALLASTGTPQREGKRIGPLPHVQRALAALRE